MFLNAPSYLIRIYFIDGNIKLTGEEGPKPNSQLELTPTSGSTLAPP